MDLSSDERDLVILSHTMQELEGNKAWERLKEIGRAQIEVRKDMLMAPIHEVNMQSGLPSPEFLKGVIFGINLFLTTPQNIITDARGILRERGDQDAVSEGDEDENESVDFSA